MKRTKLISLFLICAMMGSTAACGNNVVPPVESPTEAVTTAESSDDSSNAETIPDEEPVDDEINTRGGSPWIDSDLKENISADMPTDPKVDFHLYVNKDWLLNSSIPDGHFSWSHYEERNAEVLEQCLALLEDDSIEGRDAEMIRTLYQLILDWDARDTAGISELEDHYNRIYNIKSIDELTALLQDKEMLSEVPTLCWYYTRTGLNDPDHYIVFVDQNSLFLGDAEEYKNRSEYGEIIYAYIHDLTVYLGTKFGMSEQEAEDCFEKSISLDTLLAEKSFTTEEQNDESYFEKCNNEMSFDELTSHCQKYPLSEILKSDGFYYDGSYCLTNIDYLDVLDSIYTEEHLEEIKAWMLVKYMIGYSDVIDHETDTFTTELANQYFGSSGKLDDRENAYYSVASKLPESMQKVYIQKYCSAEDKQKMTKLCQDVIDTYREMLAENDWASDEVKSYAQEKLDKITIHAAYPEKFRDNSSLDLKGCSLIEAARRIARFESDYEASLCGKATDAEQWASNMDILECNAYYDPSSNSINMVIGMMGEPFYSNEMSTEELYASIGAFWVGHEVSHAFDSTGAQFDAEGNLRNWWTEKDAEEFASHIEKMDKYLDSIVAFGDTHFNGANIDTEMAADMTGLQCALRMASKVEGFDYDKFFTKYAQMNARLNIYSQELSIVMQDVHPLEYSRTNVPVQQFEEFYKTYNVQEGDNMYLAPENRLRIW